METGSDVVCGGAREGGEDDSPTPHGPGLHLHGRGYHEDDSPTPHGPGLSLN
jgi:hypothetical protein